MVLPVQHCINDTHDHVLQELWLQHLFRDVDPTGAFYHACSMICYYQGHHTALVMRDGSWVSFDDTHVKHVGTWQDAMAKCQAGKMQPVALFYECVQG